MLSFKNNKKLLITFASSALFSLNAFSNEFNFMDSLKEPDFYFSNDAVNIYNYASTGDIQKIKKSVIEGGKIESKGPANPGKNLNQITLLSYALGVNNFEAVKTLIESGADPTFSPTPRQDNSFTFAIMRKNIPALETLLSLWPANKISNFEKNKHLFTAASYGCKACIQTFISHKYNINSLNYNNENLFIYSLYYQEWDLALWLLKDANIAVNVESKDGITPQNAIQFYSYQQKPKSVAKDKLLEMQSIMTKKYNIRFPVLTRIQIKDNKNSNN